MKRVLTGLVLGASVVALVLWANPLAITLACLVVALLASWEYSRLTGAVPGWWMLLAAITLFGFAWFRPLEAVLPVVSALTLLLGIAAGLLFSGRGQPERALPVTASGVLGLIYVVYPMTLLPQMAMHENGPALLLFLLLVVWCGDIAALYVGRSYGRHRLAPSVSPNKSWEGAIASVAGSVLVALLLTGVAHLLNARGSVSLHITQPLWQTLVLAAVVNVAAQLGDLFESALKRGAGVKDSGTLLPGHGGVLDRIDALLTAAPVLWILLLLKEATLLGPF